MKHTIKMLAGGAALLIAAASCSDDYAYETLAGDGRVSVNASISSDVKVVSRTDAAQLREQYGETMQLWITKPGSGPVRRYEGADALPTAPIVLPGGSYVAEAWAGDSVGASFDAKYFKAFQPFEVKAGQTTPLNVTLKLANTVVSLDYADNIEDYLKGDFTMTVGHSRATVDFVNRESRKAYFMMPSTDTDLTLTLHATDYAGKPYEQTAIIADARPAVEYVVHITANGQVEAAGGALFNLDVDYTEIDEVDEIPITLAPEIDGVGFNLADMQSGEEGNMGRYSVYITAADELKNVELSSADFQGAFGWTNIDLLTSEQSYLDQLAAKGVTIKKVVSEATGAVTNLRINLEDEWTSTLSAGTHTYDIKAVDVDGRESAATLSLDVTDLPVVMLPVNNASYTTATLRATIVKPQAGAQGHFLYREADDQSRAADWNRVDAVINGSEMTADVANLKLYTRYEYKAVYAGTELLSPMTFNTIDGLQVPDADFEKWFNDASSKNASCVGTSKDTQWWDSGNHGSRTMGGDVTASSSQYFHSGKLSACLSSQFVGLTPLLGKFAAGNLFSGKYLKTDGTDGELGFGRPFSFEYRPKGFSGYARYEQGTVDQVNGGNKKKGDPDEGIIYVALLSADKSVQGSSEYPDYPVVIKTKSKKLFNPEGSNVISYGVMRFSSNFGGNGMARFEAELKDVNPNQEVAYIMIVASASVEGDYFTGSTKSKLWIDDFHLDY